jgi:hypothetical protein
MKAAHLVLRVALGLVVVSLVSLVGPVSAAKKTKKLRKKGPAGGDKIEVPEVSIARMRKAEEMSRHA